MCATTVAVRPARMVLGDVPGNVARAWGRGTGRRGAGRWPRRPARTVDNGYTFRDANELRPLGETLSGAAVGRLCPGRRRLCRGHGRRGSSCTGSPGSTTPVSCATARSSLVTGRSSSSTPRSGGSACATCCEMEFPEWIRTAALQGIDILCTPTNWPTSPRPSGELRSR